MKNKVRCFLVTDQEVLKLPNHPYNYRQDHCGIAVRSLRTEFEFMILKNYSYLDLMDLFKEYNIEYNEVKPDYYRK